MTYFSKEGYPQSWFVFPRFPFGYAQNEYVHIYIYIYTYIYIYMKTYIGCMIRLSPPRATSSVFFLDPCIARFDFLLVMLSVVELFMSGGSALLGGPLIRLGMVVFLCFCRYPIWGGV